MLKFMAFLFMGQYFVFAMNVYDTTLVCNYLFIQSPTRNRSSSKKQEAIYTQLLFISSLDSSHKYLDASFQPSYVGLYCISQLPWMMTSTILLSSVIICLFSDGYGVDGSAGLFVWIAVWSTLQRFRNWNHLIAVGSHTYFGVWWVSNQD
jgi:hypothetical protein